MTGFSLWNKGELIEYGSLVADKKEKDIMERMSQMYFKIKDLLEKSKPDFVVLEGVQYQNSFKTLMQLSQLQGIIISLLFERNIGYVLIEPTAWKAFMKITGRKRVDQKASAIQKVKELFNIDAEEDVAEAVLIGSWGVASIYQTK